MEMMNNAIDHSEAEVVHIAILKNYVNTSIIIAEFPISRSQAKRLCNRFEEFEVVELDFEGISEIGQGFAH